MASDTISEDFDAAAAFVRGNPMALANINQTQQLQLYAMFKYSTIGPCNVPAPGLFAGFADKVRCEDMCGGIVVSYFLGDYLCFHRPNGMHGVVWGVV